MTLDRLAIDPALLERFPDLQVRAWRARHLLAAARAVAVPPAGEVAHHLRARLGVGDPARPGAAPVGEVLGHDPSVAAWRAAARACGVRPSAHRSSPEALARRFLAGGGVATPLPVVDAYCATSARHLAPLGAYDLDRLPAGGGELALRQARPTDRFAPLGGAGPPLPLSAPVAVYAVGDLVCCWGFNHRDSAETCLTATTDQALFVGEAVAVGQRGDLAAAVAELRRLLADAGAALSPVAVVDGDAPVAPLP